MTSPHDLDRQLQAFLGDGPTQLPDPSFDAVRDRIEGTRQRVVIGPWRMPDMNKLVTTALGAAAVVVALVLGSQLLPLGGGVGGDPTPPASPTATPTLESSASPTAWYGIPEGPHPVTDSSDAAQVAIDIAAPGWQVLEGLDGVTKNDDGLDPPQSVGAALLTWAWPAGTGFDVYRDPCRWQSTSPTTAATTPDEIAAAFAEQTASDPTVPTDVTVDGYAGKAITLHVPLTYDIPGTTREERFAACDNANYAFYGIDGEEVDERNAQGAGQVDELWILDVDGKIVIIDATYSPATPGELVDEVRALAESATFK